MTKKNFEDHMLYVGDHMTYAIAHLEAIKNDAKIAEAFEKSSGYCLDDLIDELDDIKSDFNYHAYHCDADFVEDEDDEMPDYTTYEHDGVTGRIPK